MTDRLHPLTTLSPDELRQIRVIARQDPSVIEAAVYAALAHCEDLAEQMVKVAREAAP